MPSCAGSPDNNMDRTTSMTLIDSANIPVYAVQPRNCYMTLHYMTSHYNSVDNSNSLKTKLFEELN